MSTQSTRPGTGVVPALAISAGMSALGGAAVWFSTSDLGYALTAGLIGLVIGLAIFLVVAGTGRTR